MCEIEFDVLWMMKIDFELVVCNVEMMIYDNLCEYEKVLNDMWYFVVGGFDGVVGDVGFVGFFGFDMFVVLLWCGSLVVFVLKCCNWCIK